MKKWLCLVLLLTLVPPARAADLKPADFAYGLAIKVPPKTAIAALSLPEQIYTSTFRTDLGDIRLFNANGEPVPHMLRYARTEPAESVWQTLAFFPLPGKIKTEDGGYQVYVQTGPDGAIVRVNPQREQLPGNPTRTFLVDVSHFKRALAQLKFEWQPVRTNLMATFSVETSDDLVTWKTLRPQSAMADIQYGGHRLRKNTINLGAVTQKYLRLQQLGAEPPLPLVRITGRMKPEARVPIRTFLSVAGHPVAQSPGVFEYRTTGVFPVDRVNLRFEQANSMAQATIASRPTSRTNWKRRHRGLFYRIDVATLPLTSAPQAVAISMDRFWRLTVDASDSTIGSAVPRLEIGYRPHDLFFIARGSGPFTLAFGSALVKPIDVNVAALFDGIRRQQTGDPKRWVNPERNRIVLGGPLRLQPPPETLPIRRIVLWAVLVAGVLVVAAMAIRLARRLKT